MESEARKDCFAVFRIFDAIIARMVVEQPNIQNVLVMTDNAKRYKNLVLPVAFVYIAFHHNIFLNGIIHPETACGKSIVDPHFPISMMHVHRFVTETETNVMNLLHIVEALN